MRCDLLRGPVGLSAFAPAAASWLARDPVLHNHLNTVVRQRLDAQLPVEPDGRWALVYDDAGRLDAVAVWTPPHLPLVPALDAAVASCLVDAYLKAGLTLPGVTGLSPGPDAVASAWKERTGGTSKPGLSSRLFVLESLRPPAGVPGRLIRADYSYHVWLTRAVAGFTREAHGEELPDPAAEATALLASGLVWLWEVRGEPVSVATARPAVHGVQRIAMVHTPPEQRRHGYAAAAVAELCRHLLGIGAAAVVLYADVANPTSTGVYQRIGFRPRAEAATWLFTP